MFTDAAVQIYQPIAAKIVMINYLAACIQMVYIRSCTDLPIPCSQKNNYYLDKLFCWKKKCFIGKERFILCLIICCFISFFQINNRLKNFIFTNKIFRGKNIHLFYCFIANFSSFWPEMDKITDIMNKTTRFVNSS